MKPLSRSKRWEAATTKLRDVVNKASELQSELEDALSELKDLQSEFEEWQGNLPDSLQSSPVGDKLQAMVDIDLEVELDISEAERAADECENADLPLGFGRD